MGRLSPIRRNISDEDNQECFPVHIAQQNSIACFTCQKSFSRSDPLKRHKKTCGSSKQSEKPTDSYPCSVCSKTFLRKDKLRDHEKSCMESHIKYACTICNKPFSRNVNMSRFFQKTGRESFASFLLCPTQEVNKIKVLQHACYNRPRCLGNR